MSTTNKPVPLSTAWLKEKFENLTGKSHDHMQDLAKEVNEHLAKPQSTFTIAEIKAYMQSHNSISDMMDNLNEENIIKANQHEAVEA